MRYYQQVFTNHGGAILLYQPELLYKKKIFHYLEGPSYEAKNGLFIKIFSERKYSDQNNENIQLLCSKYQIRWRYCISFATLSLLYPQVSCNIDGGRKQPPPRQLYIKPVKQNLVNTSKASSLQQNHSSYVLSWCFSITMFTMKSKAAHLQAILILFIDTLHY